MIETVEQYLARGGKIQHVKIGESGFNADLGVSDSRAALMLKSATVGSKSGGSHPKKVNYFFNKKR